MARAARLAARQALEIADDFREQRLTLSLSQDHVAAAAGMSRTRYGLIERSASTSLSLDELHAIAGVLGLRASVRLYPDGPPVRDAAHASRLAALLGQVRPPLTYRLEVALPIVEGRPERRAWDAVVFAGRARCAIELEMRLRDVQALLRRIELKRRDDPTERFVLAVADTRHNRRVLAEFAPLFADLPRLRPADVRKALLAGEHPRTGLVLL